MSKSALVSIVEDDGSFRDSMSMLLTSFGYSVEAFPSMQGMRFRQSL
jgi:FixJ family two-component response regulator